MDYLYKKNALEFELSGYHLLEIGHLNSSIHCFYYSVMNKAFNVIMLNLKDINGNKYNSQTDISDDYALRIKAMKTNTRGYHKWIIQITANQFKGIDNTLFRSFFDELNSLRQLRNKADYSNELINDQNLNEFSNLSTKQDLIDLFAKLDMNIKKII